MKKGKHVLGQKPMTHSVGEARRMAQTARETKVATSVTVNNPSSEASATIRGWIQQGLIGKVTILNGRAALLAPGRGASERDVPSRRFDGRFLGPAPDAGLTIPLRTFSCRGRFDFGCDRFGDRAAKLRRLFKILTDTAAAFEATQRAVEETFPRLDRPLDFRPTPAATP